MCYCAFGYLSYFSFKQTRVLPTKHIITRLSSRARCSKLYNLLYVTDPQRTRYFSSLSALSEKSDPCSLRNPVSWQRSTHVFEGKRGATRYLIQQVVQVVVLGESALIPVAVWQGIDGEDEEAVEQEVEEDPLWLLLVQLSLAGLCQNLAGHRVRRQSCGICWQNQISRVARLHHTVGVCQGCVFWHRSEKYTL